MPRNQRRYKPTGVGGGNSDRKKPLTSDQLTVPDGSYSVNFKIYFIVAKVDEKITPPKSSEIATALLSLDPVFSDSVISCDAELLDKYDSRIVGKRYTRNTYSLFIPFTFQDDTDYNPCGYLECSEHFSKYKNNCYIRYMEFRHTIGEYTEDIALVRWFCDVSSLNFQDYVTNAISDALGKAVKDYADPNSMEKGPVTFHVQAKFLGKIYTGAPQVWGFVVTCNYRNGSEFLSDCLGASRKVSVLGQPLEIVLCKKSEMPRLAADHIAQVDEEMISGWRAGMDEDLSRVVVSLVGSLNLASFKRTMEEHEGVKVVKLPAITNMLCPVIEFDSREAYDDLRDSGMLIDNEGDDLGLAPLSNRTATAKKNLESNMPPPGVVDAHLKRTFEQMVAKIPGARGIETLTSELRSEMQQMVTSKTAALDSKITGLTNRQEALDKKVGDAVEEVKGLASQIKETDKKVKALSNTAKKFRTEMIQRLDDQDSSSKKQHADLMSFLSLHLGGAGGAKKTPKKKNANNVPNFQSPSASAIA
eukprot:CAMPEP_0113938376 /NCGR_PEP_ID=MMETSP1339-20121228/4815_1 /TAXON_ID=94617 /ORGANISM="Fibrocapsa japonica" /LENGTH=530 /DNA_ID=CAMNT_0000941471 /DNA_START=120 /DNA_END=1712 /DNA_ORIENTATION=- /assembly_acc=CAM_ASM_000762